MTQTRSAAGEMGCIRRVPNNLESADGAVWTGQSGHKGDVMRRVGVGMEKREEEMAGTWEGPERMAAEMTRGDDDRPVPVAGWPPCAHKAGGAGRSCCAGEQKPARDCKSCPSLASRWTDTCGWLDWHGACDAQAPPTTLSAGSSRVHPGTAVPLPLVHTQRSAAP